MTDSFTALPSQYDHAGAQSRWYSYWESRGYFHADVASDKPPFSIVIPPPNVTGALHLGHALNNTLQDILVRLKRMQGYNVLWMPGTDHAGIATQAVVERRLLEEEKKSRHDLGRDGLVERIWQWKEQYERRIIGQLKQLGCSCDWQRLRFTLDDQCARAVRETFFRLFQDGKIYRGKRLVNWDTYLQTAVSDDEVFHETVKGHFWHFRYPVVKDDAWRPGDVEFVTIATTRPETMLGDTAVAVHPDPARALDDAEAALNRKRTEAAAKDGAAIDDQIAAIRERRKTHLPQLLKLRDMAQRGVMLELPLTGRTIPLIADEWAKPELGSGCVKITPAHDENDYQVGQRHPEIGAINIMTVDGHLNDAVPEKYRGLKMHTKARDAVVADMEAAGLYNPETDREDREIDLAHSDRSKTPIEPYLADQWFLQMQDVHEVGDGLAQLAMNAVMNSRVNIVPDRYSKSYLDWLSEKRDWPIGRQLWWGHRIPVWCAEEDIFDREPFDSSLADKLREWAEAGRLYSGGHHHESTIGKDSVESIQYRFLNYCVRDDEDHEVIEALQAAGYVRDEGVLDTWFSSALWPHSTLGWPDQTPELKKFYPTSVLVTSRDIITLWVARMVLAGLYNMGEIPFKEVYIHPKILDGYGETMSKSKGNGVDPLDVIEKFGADALRFGIAYLCTETQDVRMPVEFECPHCQALIPQTKKNRTQPRVECEKCHRPFRTQWAESHGSEEDKRLPRGAVVSERFELGRRFCNKVWNAARFSLMNLADFNQHKAATVGRGPVAGGGTVATTREKTATGGRGFVGELLLEDRWILSRLNTVTRDVTAALDSYRFADSARALYAFAWNDFCDYYVEMTKARFASPEQKPAAQQVLAHVLDALVRLLHPMTPFLAEEVWQLLGQAASCRGLPSPAVKEESVCVAAWPTVDAALIDATIEEQFADFQAVLGAVRELRMAQNIPPREAVQFAVTCDDATAKLLAPMQPYFTQMAKATATAWGPQAAAPEVAATGQASGARGAIVVHLDVSQFIDVEAEKVRLKKQLDQLLGFVKSIEGKLANDNFVSRAPAEVVQQQRDKLAEVRGQIASTEAALGKLGR
jgi:valyl-tRNA synthetase